jgi:hypothetical protein
MFKEAAKNQKLTPELKFWPGMRKSLSKRFWVKKKTKIKILSNKRNCLSAGIFWLEKSIFPTLNFKIFFDLLFINYI